MRRPCSQCGMTAKVRKCSRCRGAFYCSTECQKTAWKKHKVKCKQASSPHEYVINQSDGLKQSADCLYSVNPAKDVLKLAENEGESWTSTLRLLLVGFCDLKDFIFTMVLLPEGCAAPLEFHMVDANPMCIARAAILLNILQKMIMAWGEDEKKMQYASWRQSFFLIWYSTTLGQQESSILKETMGAFLNRESRKVFRELASFLNVECVGNQTGWVYCCHEYLNCEWEVDEMKDAVWNMKGREDPADLRHNHLHNLPEISKHEDPEVFSSLERVLGSGSILPSEVQAATSSPPAASAPAGAATTAEEDYRAVSVKELKSRLSALKVNSSHCVEKQDLVDLLKASPSSSGGNLANPTPESELRINPTMLSPYMPGKMVYAVPPGAIPFGGWPITEVEAHGAAQGLMPHLLASYISLVLAKLDAAVAALARRARAGRPVKVVLCNNEVRALRDYPRAGDGFDRIVTSTLADWVGLGAVLRYTGPLLRPGSPHAVVVMELQSWTDEVAKMDYEEVSGALMYQTLIFGASEDSTYGRQARKAEAMARRNGGELSPADITGNLGVFSKIGLNNSEFAMLFHAAATDSLTDESIVEGNPGLQALIEKISTHPEVKDRYSGVHYGRPHEAWNEQEALEYFRAYLVLSFPNAAWKAEEGAGGRRFRVAGLELREPGTGNRVVVNRPVGFRDWRGKRGLPYTLEWAAPPPGGAGEGGRKAKKKSRKEHKGIMKTW